MLKIMFVCHGNICRSPMAEFVMRDLVEKAGLSQKISIASSATSREEIGNPVHYGTRNKLAEVGISTSGKYAVQFTKKDYKNYDYIVLMDRFNQKNLTKIIGADNEQKVALLLDYAGGGEVADPWYTGDFEETYRDVLSGCKGLLAHIQKNL